MAYFTFMAFITGFNLIPGFPWRLNNISAFHSEKTFILKIRELRWKDRSPPTLSGMSQIFVAQPGAPPRFANILFSCSFLQDNVLFAFPWTSFPISSGTGIRLRQYSRWFSLPVAEPGRIPHGNPFPMEFVFVSDSSRNPVIIRFFPDAQFLMASLASEVFPDFLMQNYFVVNCSKKSFEVSTVPADTPKNISSFRSSFLVRCPDLGTNAYSFVCACRNSTFSIEKSETSQDASNAAHWNFKTIRFRMIIQKLDFENYQKV